MNFFNDDQRQLVSHHCGLYSKGVFKEPFFITSSIDDQRFLDDFKILLRNAPTIQQFMEFKTQVHQNYSNSQGYDDYSMYLGFFIQEEIEIRDAKCSMLDIEFLAIYSEFVNHVKNSENFLSFQEKLVEKYGFLVSKRVMKSIAREYDIQLGQVE